jgi:hypothetical protein
MTGWISGEYPPVDLWLIDAYLLFSLSSCPHFAFVTAGMCLALSLWLDFLNNPDWRLVGYVLLIAVLVQFANPIAFALVDAGFAGAALFAWWGQGRLRVRDLAALGIVAAGQLPLLIYNLAILSRDPVWSQFTAQNQTPSPPPDYYLWSFGVFWPFAFAGAWFALRARNPALGAALAWAAAAFALAYAPFNIQRRFLQGVTIPLAVLAGWGLMRLFEARAALSPGLRRWRGALASAFILIASISTIFFIVGQTIYMRSRPAKYFYPAGLEEAAGWLGQHASPGEFALAAEPTGSLLAQRSGLKVYLGHPMETLDYPAKQAIVDAYYEGRLPPEWLGATPISLVIYGPYEREIAPDFVPGPDLAIVYRNADVVIYTVK